MKQWHSAKLFQNNAAVAVTYNEAYIRQVTLVFAKNAAEETYGRLKMMPVIDFRFLIKNFFEKKCSKCYEKKVFCKEMCASCYRHNYNSLRKKAWTSLPPQNILEQVNHTTNYDDEALSFFKKNWDMIKPCKTFLRYQRTKQGRLL